MSLRFAAIILGFAASSVLAIDMSGAQLLDPVIPNEDYGCLTKCISSAPSCASHTTDFDHCVCTNKNLSTCTARCKTPFKPTNCSTEDKAKLHSLDSRECFSDCQLEPDKCPTGPEWERCPCKFQKTLRCARKCREFTVLPKVCPTKPSPEQCTKTCISDKKCIASFPAGCACQNSQKRVCSKKCGSRFEEAKCTPNCIAVCMADTKCPTAPFEKCTCEQEKSNECRKQCGVAPLALNKCSPEPLEGCFSECIAKKNCPTDSDTTTSEYEKCKCRFDAATECAPGCGVRVKLIPCTPPSTCYEECTAGLNCGTQPSQKNCICRRDGAQQCNIKCPGSEVTPILCLKDPEPLPV